MLQWHGLNQRTDPFHLNLFFCAAVELQTCRGNSTRLETPLVVLINPDSSSTARVSSGFNSGAPIITFCSKLLSQSSAFQHKGTDSGAHQIGWRGAEKTEVRKNVIVREFILFTLLTGTMHNTAFFNLQCGGPLVTHGWILLLIYFSYIHPSATTSKPPAWYYVGSSCAARTALTSKAWLLRVSCGV